MQAASVSPPKITVIIPTLNEARNLPHAFSRLPQHLHEVIVVDGHSVDGTLAAARRLRPVVRTIIQDRCGKGNALALGFVAATGDIIVMFDADGSADPSQIPQFVNVLLGGADFAKGTRFAGREPGGIPGVGRIVDQMLSTLINAVCHTHYSDRCYGFNAFWRRHVPALGRNEESPTRMDGTRLRRTGFEVDTLINVRAARAGLTVVEVAIYEYPRIYKVSNLNALNDGWRILLAIVAEHYRSCHRRASAIAALLVLLGADLRCGGRAGLPPAAAGQLGRVGLERLDQ
jgi:glycosyltransferase involved in cell wall biosynthesis